MRRRITLLQHPSAPFDHSQARLTPDSLSLRDLDAARQDRITLALDEIPEQIASVLTQCHEVRVRWAREEPFETPEPFASRVSPGLNVFYTPGLLETGENDNRGQNSGSCGIALCSLLTEVFGDEAGCVPESFIMPPILSTRFTSAASLNFYARLPSLEHLIGYIEHRICSLSADKEHCVRGASLLHTVDSLDLDYDSISHALTITGFWESAPRGGWNDIVRKPDGKRDQVEVGLLGAEGANEPEEIKMGGLLGVVGRDTELKPTLFSFPSRHHTLPEKTPYSISFPSPTGLHPVLTVTIPKSSLVLPPAPPDATCALHTYLTLPSSIFGDKYQLSTTDPIFLASHNLRALRAVSGETDLEAPYWTVQKWGSTWLLELASPLESERYSDQAASANAAQEDWNVTIPLHLRYLAPSPPGYRTATIPWPVVFWACTAEGGTKMGVNPFDRASLGWDGLFGPKTMFYQLTPSPSPAVSSSSSTSSGPGSRLVNEIQVPVLKLQGKGFYHRSIVELGTVFVVLGGFLWVLVKLAGVGRRYGVGRGEKRDEKKVQ